MREVSKNQRAKREGSRCSHQIPDGVEHMDADIDERAAAGALFSVNQPPTPRHEPRNSLIDRFCPQFFELRALSLRLENSALQTCRPRRISPANLRSCGALRLALFRGSALDGFEQSLPSQLPVAYLRTGILHRHAHAAGPMAQRHGGRNLIYILPARPG